MFHRFHIFILPGGPQLGTLQAQLLRDVVRDHGGCIVEDPLLLGSIARSLARKGRKQLVIVTGRSSIAQVHLDLTHALVVAAPPPHAQRSFDGDASNRGDGHGVAVRLVAELQALMTSDPPVVRCVSHHWISKSAESSRRASPGGTAMQVVTNDGTGAALEALDMRAYEVQNDDDAVPRSDRAAPSVVPQPLQPPPSPPTDTKRADVAGAHPLTTPNFLGDGATKGCVMLPTDPQETRDTLTSKHRVAVGGGGRGVGFLPVFFTGSYDTPAGCGTASKAAPISALSARQQQSAVKRLRGASSSSDDDDEHDKCLGLGKGARRERSSGGGGRGGDAVEWKDATAASYAEPVQPMVMDPGNVALHRGARFIDRAKPFVCQRPTAETGQEASMFEDDESDGLEGTAFVRPLPEAPRTSSNAATVQLNQPLLTQLAELKAVYQATGDQWRTYAYNRAIGVIKRVPFQVERVEQLASYPGLGDRILNKVREILSTGSSMKLQVLRATPRVAAIEAFSKIWGVGPSTARRLAQHPSAVPLADIAALRAAPDLATLLSPVQLAGLRHYEDLMVRIPRAEVDAMQRFVCSALKSIVGAKRMESIDLVVCGSYRRGKATSGDVDILICDRHAKHAEDGLLAQLVQCLKRPCGYRTSPRCASIDGRAKSEAQAFTAVEGKEEDNGDRLGSSTCTSVSSCKHEEKRQHLSGHRSRAFIVEDLTVSRRGMEETHSDSWFGIVQLPDCAQEAAAACPCTHRPSALLSKSEKRDSKHEAPVWAMPSTSTPADESGFLPGLGDAFQAGRHISRRMDIKCYPPHQFPFALLYFTGSDYFNRSMRLYCQKRGWSLSDKDLKPVVRVAGEKVHETSYGVPCNTERDIFDAVGLPYKAPSERDV